MKPDAALADRRQSVRDAGREWLRAGWINENAFQSIATMYPDDRVRVGPVFRILFFVLTLAAILGVIFALYSLIDSNKPIAVFALIAGIACWMTANHLIGPQKRVQGGIEAAFSLAAILNLMIGPAILLLDSHWRPDHSAISLLLFFFAILSGVAAWTWGYWPYSAFSAAFLFFAVISLPPGRVLWIIIVVVLYRWLIRGCDSMQIPPSLRKCATAFLAVALLGFYAAVNICLLDQHILTGFLYYGHDVEFFPRWLSISLTATLPCVVLFIGIVGRRRLFLILGFGFALFSLITLRMYVHVAPPWVVLTGTGILLLIVAELLRRFLDSGVNGERAGFTAAPFTEPQGKHRGMEILASIAAMTPSAPAAAENSQFHGDGGQFGGGGASGNF
jgi:hypothetical protein